MTAKANALARRLADALEAGGVPYAIGGAIALAYWAPPRRGGAWGSCSPG